MLLLLFFFIVSLVFAAPLSWRDFIDTAAIMLFHACFSNIAKPAAIEHSNNKTAVLHHNQQRNFLLADAIQFMLRTDK
jgi:hypothetical protein